MKLGHSFWWLLAALITKLALNIVSPISVATAATTTELLETNNKGRKEELDNSIKYEYSVTPVQRTVGGVVPWPRKIVFLDGLNYLLIDDTKFTLNITSRVLDKCDIVRRAVDRYMRNLLFDDLKPMDRDDRHGGARKNIGSLDVINLKPGPEFKCETMPHEDMDESYSIDIKHEANLVANSSWGLIRGLETVSQLIFNVGPSKKLHGIQTVRISDKPRFKHRGYLLDTARHYISIEKISNLLDAMAFNKMNVFHWHLIDDQSFPFESSAYPEISKQASFRPELVYTREDVKFVVRYAAERGIRVIPELDSPGHTYSLRFIPDVLTKCYNTTTEMPNGQLGPIDPTKIGSYIAISKLVKEFGQLFPDKYLHAGGDEVDFSCWQTNPTIKQWMTDRNMTGNYQKLNNYYIRRVYDLLAYYNRTMLVWQEVFDFGTELPKDAVVQVWKYINDRPAYMAELNNVLDAGYKAILSSCWYLNYIDYGQDWVKFYQCDPAGKSVAAELAHRVLGGEVCMWSEFVDDTNVMSRTWPRASAAAERLWSSESKTNVGEFMGRLEQMRCRLLFRGLQAEPIVGPGYC